ncbi:MAG: hypothetical protein QGG40_09305 [Myxococcota bacterium]|jgi:hypothetical protein|nr:hypothetical protein [Myxococcota bacterium]
MPFVPLRLLVLYDDARGYCGRVVPRMVQQLQQRAFEVDTHEIGQGAIDIGSYQGLILGSPVYGFGLKGVGPTPELISMVEGLEDLEDHRVAVFCVYELHAGTTLARMRGLVEQLGGTFVAGREYWALRPEQGAHILPAECMVRIR